MRNKRFVGFELLYVLKALIKQHKMWTEKVPVIFNITDFKK